MELLWVGKPANWWNQGIANGCFFNLGARLARYLNNQTYADWAEKTWDWMTGVGLMDADHNVFDGAHTDFNCTDVNRAQFSYNNGIFLLGAAYMYNYVCHIPPPHLLHTLPSKLTRETDRRAEMGRPR